MSTSDASVDHLVKLLARLPGVGQRSARRMALFLLQKKEVLMLPLASALQDVAQAVTACKTCGNWDTRNPCGICSDSTRDSKRLCVVEHVADLWAIERGGLFKGRYHVLGGTLSALSDTTPADLRIPQLAQRCQQDGTEEVILALGSTMDGQTTSHYVAASLNGQPLTITRLAQGIPMGGELDYLDDGTLATAMAARLPL